jgi:HlyD family secretion protein
MTSTILLKTLATASAVALLFGVAGCAKKHVPAPPGPRAVRVVTVENRALAGGVDASGVLVPREEAAVSPELSGYNVAKVFVEQDAYVKQGQPLAQLDDTLLRSQVAQQTALVAEQKAAAEQAAQQAADVAGLDNQGVLSKEQIDQRRFQARTAQAALDAQEAQLKDLQTRDGLMTIRAPVSGRILQRNVRPGDVAAPSATPMFTMARDGLIELDAQLAEGDFTGIKVGDPVNVTLPDGSSLTGTVRIIFPSIDQQTKLGDVRISLPPRPDLRPGGFARASFGGAGASQLTVPETAVRYDADGAVVMTVDATNHVHEAKVRTGNHSGGYVQLISGPPVGTRVLLAAAVFVLPGDKVIPDDVSPGGR